MAADQPLERAPQRLPRKAFQAFGKVVDAEQEQAEPTHQRDGGGGVDGRSPLFGPRRRHQYFAGTNRLLSSVARSS
jgi:hypothetical protein